MRSRSLLGPHGQGMNATLVPDGHIMQHLWLDAFDVNYARHYEVHVLWYSIPYGYNGVTH